MKILFVSVLKDFSGFANSARHFLHSLLQNDKIDVVARSVTYDKLDSGQEFVIPDWMKPSLEKDIQNVDICIQLLTCNIEAQPVPGVFNILYTFLESDRLQASWAQKANEFDLLMVPCKYNAEAMHRSGVIKPIVICPPPCDIDLYSAKYKPYEIKNSADRTIFYNISQLSGKKGIDSLLRAYFAAFADCPDEVLLVLKTYINMQDRTNDLGQIKQFIEQIKQGCRIPVQKLPPVLPIVQTLTDEEIQSLHKSGHVYVNSSRCEGWNIPCFDALGHGNIVVSNDKTGMEGYIRKEHAIIYQSMPSFFFDVRHPDPGLYTGVEQCFEPSPVDMAYIMRKIHLLRKQNDIADPEWDSVLLRQQNAKTMVRSFDYRVTVDKILDPVLEAYEGWKLTGKVSFGAQ